MTVFEVVIPSSIARTTMVAIIVSAKGVVVMVSSNADWEVDLTTTMVV